MHDLLSTRPNIVHPAMPILSEEQSRLELYSPVQFFHHSFKLHELILLLFSAN